MKDPKWLAGEHSQTVDLDRISSSQITHTHRKSTSICLDPRNYSFKERVNLADAYRLPVSALHTEGETKTILKRAVVPAGYGSISAVALLSALLGGNARIPG